MSGVYGDNLLAFPEQYRTLTIFKMDPAINGGWTVVAGSSRTVRGIYQNSRGHAIKDSNGNLAQTAGFEFWTSQKDIGGDFTEIDGKVYRLNASNDWNHEGGFIRYSLEKLVGNNGTESVNITWNTGTGSFS